MRDTQIAGIAVARHATLATRHVRHFADLKVPVVDPWTAQRPRDEEARLSNSSGKRYVITSSRGII
jgi:hypothetical protein